MAARPPPRRSTRAAVVGQTAATTTASPAVSPATSPPAQTNANKRKSAPAAEAADDDGAAEPAKRSRLLMELEFKNPGPRTAEELSIPSPRDGAVSPRDGVSPRDRRRHTTAARDAEAYAGGLNAPLADDGAPRRTPRALLPRAPRLTARGHCGAQRGP